MIVIGLTFLGFGIFFVYLICDEYDKTLLLFSLLFFLLASILLITAILGFVAAIRRTSSRVMLGFYIVVIVLLFICFVAFAYLAIVARESAKDEGHSYCSSHSTECADMLLNYTQLYCASLPLEQQEECMDGTPVEVVEIIIGNVTRAYNSVVVVSVFVIAILLAIIFVSACMACLENKEQKKDSELSEVLPDYQLSPELAS